VVQTIAPFVFLSPLQLARRHFQMFCKRLLLCLLLDTVRYVQAAWSINSKGQVVDSHGRERFFHGVNVVYKSAPYIPRTTGNLADNLGFSVADAKFLKSLGLNVIRLGAMWPGVEPVKGTYNTSYVEELRKIVRICADQGISVVLDFHQDGFSEMFCGEGVPMWASYMHGLSPFQFPFPVEGKPYVLQGNANFSGIYKDAKIPSEKDCARHQWPAYQASYAVAKNYADLYTNGRGIRDSFVAYWEHLAAEFKDEPNVLAFELMNEPGLTYNFWSFPGFIDSHYLQPLYDIVATAIRKIDPERVILFEPTTWSDEWPDVVGKIFESHLSHAPGGLVHASKSVYAYHYYSFANFLRKQSPVQDYFEARAKDALKMKVGQFVTEWMLDGCDDDWEMNILDEMKLNWIGWNYKEYVPAKGDPRAEFARTCTGCGAGLIRGDPAVVNWKNAKCVARAYPKAVQGQLASMSFNATSSVFVLKYEMNLTVSEPTVIYVNTEPLNQALDGSLLGADTFIPARYANGVDVSITPPGAATWSLSGQELQISGKNLASAQQVTVTVRPHVDDAVNSAVLV